MARRSDNHSVAPGGMTYGHFSENLFLIGAGFTDIPVVFAALSGRTVRVTSPTVASTLRAGFGFCGTLMSTLRTRLLFLVFLFPLYSELATASVQDSAESGFTIEHSVTLPVTRAVAWAAVVGDIGRWWNSEHTVSGDAANLYISAVPMGCFCERLGENGGLVHLMVTFVNPGVILRLTGGLGPLGLMGVSGNMTLEFEDLGDDPGQSTITLRYAVGGYRAEGLDELAEPVDAVLGEQLERLVDYVEAL